MTIKKANTVVMVVQEKKKCKSLEIGIKLSNINKDIKYSLSKLSQTNKIKADD